MKRFTLKRMALSLVTSLMLMASQSVYAQYVPLTVVNGSYSYGQSAKNPGSHAFDKLVDTKKTTMWSAWLNPSLSDDEAYPANTSMSANVLYVIVKAEKAVVPTFYFLINSDGINKEPKNNWKSWKIYAGNFESDEQLFAMARAGHWLMSAWTSLCHQITLRQRTWISTRQMV